MIKTATPPLALDWDPSHEPCLAAGFEDGSVAVHDIRYTNGVVAKYTGHSGCVCNIAFSPDGATLATAADDSTVHLLQFKYQPSSQPELSSPPAAASLSNQEIYRGHSDYVRGLAWGPDDAAESVVSGAWDGALHSWAPVERG